MFQLPKESVFVSCVAQPFSVVCRAFFSVFIFFVLPHNAKRCATVQVHYTKYGTWYLATNSNGCNVLGPATAMHKRSLVPP